MSESNHDPIGHLAGHPYRDPRVGLREDDVLQVLLESPAAFDVILMNSAARPRFHGEADEQPGSIPATGWWRCTRPLAGRAGRLLVSHGVTGFRAPRLDAQPWFWRREDVPLFAARADAFHHIYLASGQAGQIGLPDYRAHAVAAG